MRDLVAEIVILHEHLIGRAEEDRAAAVGIGEFLCRLKYLAVLLVLGIEKMHVACGNDRLIELTADNGVGRTLFIAGAVCIVLGVGGVISIILWQRASRNRDSGEADRAEVLDEIEQEERRNRRRREEERMRREQMQARREAEPRMPTSPSSNSEPDLEKNVTMDSPATALASNGLPVPRGPTSSAPFGSFAPIFVYFSGL